MFSPTLPIIEKRILKKSVVIMPGLDAVSGREMEYHDSWTHIRSKWTSKQP